MKREESDKEVLSDHGSNLGKSIRRRGGEDTADEQGNGSHHWQCSVTILLPPAAILI